MLNRESLELARIDRRGLLNLDRLKRGMAARALDAVVASSTVNVTYTGGGFIDYATLLTYSVTVADGRQAIVINEGDAAYFREYSWIQDIRTFRYQLNSTYANRQGVALLAETLRDLGLGRAAIGLERSHLPVLYCDELARLLPDAEWRDGSDLFHDARLIKTPAEVELLRCAAHYSARAVETGLAIARPGMAEKDVAVAIQAHALAFGADTLDHADVHAGAHALVVHAWPMQKPFEPGELIHVDFGAVFGGYTTDIARNAVVGPPTAKQERYYRLMYEIQQEILTHVRPGIAAGELYERGIRSCARLGLDYPWGTLGHSTGLEIHEGFEISRGSEQLLETGMVINIEPTHIEKGEGRWHLEDTFLLTETGPELLSDFGSRQQLLVIE